MVEIEKTTGAPPEHWSMARSFRNPAASREELRKTALQTIAYELAIGRRLLQVRSEEQALSRIMSWSDVILPDFRKHA